MPVEHGGDIGRAAARYGIPREQWLDLSTGINPRGWPVKGLPPECWRRLPEAGDGLEKAARACYAASHLLPAAGTQAVIQALPGLRPPGRVAVIHPGYAEHGRAWARLGHHVEPVAAERLAAAVAGADVVVLAHPNNPTGTRFPPELLLDWHRRLAARGGWLVVDEAFMDPTPEQSLCPHASAPGLVVLRSVGKFFGLAGARVGFACAHPALLARLEEALGPWPVSTPARRVAAAALAHRRWQAAARRWLHAGAARLHALLSRHGLAPAGGCALFQWVPTPRAGEIHEALARRGILTRLFTRPPGLRLGLPGSEYDWRRLETALRQPDLRPLLETAS